MVHELLTLPLDCLYCITDTGKSQPGNLTKILDQNCATLQITRKPLALNVRGRPTLNFVAVFPE